MELFTTCDIYVTILILLAKINKQVAPNLALNISDYLSTNDFIYNIYLI